MRFPVKLLPDAIQILKNRYTYLEDSFQGFVNLRNYPPYEDVFVETLDFTRDHAVYGVGGEKLIGGIAVKIVSLKIKKNLTDYL